MIVKAMRYIDEHYGDGITAAELPNICVDRAIFREFHAANDMTMKNT